MDCFTRCAPSQGRFPKIFVSYMIYLGQLLKKIISHTGRGTYQSGPISWESNEIQMLVPLNRCSSTRFHLAHGGCDDELISPAVLVFN
jgi:hypothetical protein